MADRNRGTGRDRILVAQLTGTAGHHAKWRELAGAEEAAAVTELRELAAGRSDLLAGGGRHPRGHVRGRA